MNLTNRHRTNIRVTRLENDILVDDQKTKVLVVCENTDGTFTYKDKVLTEQEYFKLIKEGGYKIAVAIAEPHLFDTEFNETERKR